MPSLIGHTFSTVHKLGIHLMRPTTYKYSKLSAGSLLGHSVHKSNLSPLHFQIIEKMVIKMYAKNPYT